MFKNSSCLHIKINIEGNPHLMGPLGSVADSMREIHLALAVSCSPRLHHTCPSKNTPLLINQALGTTLTAHGISLVSFNDCIEIIKAESEYQNTQLKNSIKQVWNCEVSTEGLKVLRRWGPLLG